MYLHSLGGNVSPFSRDGILDFFMDIFSVECSAFSEELLDSRLYASRSIRKHGSSLSQLPCWPSARGGGVNEGRASNVSGPQVVAVVTIAKRDGGCCSSALPVS